MVRQHDVLECHHVTGEESFILKVKTANTDSLERLLGEIRSMEGVTRTVTKVVLSTPKESQVLEFEQAGNLDLPAQSKAFMEVPEKKRWAEGSRKK
jgi:DNA-binding Lrp family transcriptional regulator